MQSVLHQKTGLHPRRLSVLCGVDSVMSKAPDKTKVQGREYGICVVQKFSSAQWPYLRL